MAIGNIAIFIFKSEQQFKIAPNCRGKEVLGGSKASTEYQELKANDVTDTVTIVYDPSLETKRIQTQKYLDWIKTHYGIALINILKKQKELIMVKLIKLSIIT